jgi:sodium-coupled neutral amino acid transporter 9
MSVGDDAAESAKAPLIDYEGGDGEGLEGDDGDGSGQEYRQTRVQTVMSIVNTMMGTTIVALPFGLAESGLGTGLFITAILGAISCYTCLIIVESSKAGAEDFALCVRQFLGQRVQLLAWAISVAIILGAAIVYHILMQETLFALVSTLILSARPDVVDVSQVGWRREWAALIPWFLYPISNLKDLSLLVKMNSIGFLFLAYVIVFIVSHGFHAMIGENVPMTAVATLPASASVYTPTGLLQIVVGGTPNFASLGGMMMLSFFIHNCIQPIIKNANPKTRRVDIMIA